VPGGCQSLATSDFGQGTITVDATRPSTAARGGPKFAQTERLATAAAGGAMVKVPKALIGCFRHEPLVFSTCFVTDGCQLLLEWNLRNDAAPLVK